MTSPHTDVSKFLSYILRHKPDAINLELDPEGWANIEELISKTNIPLTHDVLLEVVSTSDKKRFSMSTDDLSVRASQGHSIDVDLGLQPTEPPKFLYHGTATHFLDSILEQGLLSQNRQYVHLSSDEESAIEVGKRHGKPVILTIPAHEMHKQGHGFFLAQNGVWLTKHVPAAAITGY